MSNEEMFNTFARRDFEKVNQLLGNGDTEISDFKESLEILHSSIGALLQDMDRENEDIAEMSAMSEIHFGYTELSKSVNGAMYTAATSGGIFYGYATIADGKCLNFDIKYSECQIDYFEVVGGEKVKYKPKDFYDPEYDKITHILWGDFMEYLEERYVSSQIKEIA